MEETEISVIILCYRSEGSVIDFAGQAELIVKSVTDSYEIILVGNYIEGENDCTKDIVRKLAEGNSRIKAICLPKTGMMGWDMRLGLEAAVGKYLCVIDGDGQFPIESIAECYRKIVDSRYDLVKTYRSSRNDGFYRRIISSVYNMLFRIIFPGLNSKDINSKPKILTRMAYERMDVRSDDWFVDAEIMINIRRYNMLIYEFPIEFGELAGRVSFVKLGAILEFIKNLVVYRIREFKK